MQPDRCASTRGISLGQAHLYAMARPDTVLAISATGSARPLVKLPRDGFEAIVSPDGRWVAYARPGGLYAMHTDGTGNRHLVFGSGRVLAWAPDSRSVLLVRIGRPVTIVHVANRASRALEKGNDINVYGATFSPDGRHVLVSDRRGWRLIRTSDGAQRRVAKVPCAEAFDITWSPDGHRVAVACNANFRPSPRIAILTIASGRVQRLSADWAGSGPVWLSNSSLLVQQGSFHDHPRLNTYNLSGRLTGTRALSAPLELLPPSF